MRRWMLAALLFVLLNCVAEARRPRIALKPVTATQLETELRSAHGRARLVHLWASWCVPCVAEWPIFAAYLRQIVHRPIDIVTVSLDDAGHAQQAARVLSQSGRVPGETLIALPAQAMAAVKSIDPQWDGALPLTLLLDDEGHIILAQRGATQLNELRREVDRVVRPSLSGN